jgi:uncharacterized lipoprotein
MKRLIPLESPMTSTSRVPRPKLLVGVAALAILLATSGCSWFRHKTDYQASREANPLEVPPDLDRPDTSAATSMPLASTAGPPVAASARDVRLSMPASEAYPRIGEALATVPGLVVNGRADALHSFDVTYKGESFLLRVLDATGGSRLVALSADGRLLTSGTAAELMVALKAKL